MRETACRKEELYMVRVEVEGFEGVVVEGMQQLPVAFDTAHTVEIVHTCKSAYSPADY